MTSSHNCFITCSRCNWNFVEQTTDVFSVVMNNEGVAVKGSDDIPCPRCNSVKYQVVDIDADSKEAYDKLIEQRNWRENNFQLLLPEEQAEVLKHNYHQLQLEFLL